MGSWGTGISSNDVYEDVYSEFMDFYDEGLEPIEATKKVIENNSELVNDPEDKFNFWFALAMAQWTCKALDHDLLDKVKDIIDSGKDITLWKELGAESTELKQREKALAKFLDKISQEKEKPRKRKKKVIRDAVYEKGSCLTFKLDNGNFGAACVLEAVNQSEFAANLITVCDYNNPNRPDLDYFKRAEVLITKQQGSSIKFEDTPVIHWHLTQFYKKKTIEFSVVGNLDVKLNYYPESDYRSWSQWDYIAQEVMNWTERINEHGQPKMTLKLKKLRTKSWL